MEERFETFTVLINRISRNVRKIKNQEMAEYHLKSVHVSCLYYLFQSGKLIAADLCERCEEDKATISRALEYLEKEGYLICDSRGSRRYKSPILLTEKGQALGARIAAKIDSVLEEISKELTEEERVSFYHSLARISESLSEVAQSPHCREDNALQSGHS